MELKMEESGQTKRGKNNITGERGGKKELKKVSIKQMENKQIRIVFMGSPDYGVAVLNPLVEKFSLIAVYTQPDKPVGRKKILTPTPVKKRAVELEIPVFTPSHLKKEVNRLKQLKPDFIVTAAYGLLLPEEILAIAPAINLHGSLLPKYRGASPIQSALLNREWQTGVTAILMEKRLDAGPILGWKCTEIGKKNSIELYRELGELAGELAVEVIERFSEIEPLPQLEAFASYCKKIQKEDGKISFEMEAIEIWNRYRAFQPWPQIFTSQFKLLKIELAEIKEDAKNRNSLLFQRVGKPGEIVEINRKEGWGMVACGKGAIKIYTVQPPGKRPMGFLDYLNGVKNLQ